MLSDGDVGVVMVLLISDVAMVMITLMTSDLQPTVAHTCL